MAVAATVAKNYFIKKSAPASTSIVLNIIYICLAIVWLFVFTNYLMAFAVTLLAVLNFYAAKKKAVRFSVNGILLDTFFKKNIDWQQLNNVVLKDGLLTIDFLNNKIIQQLIEETENNEQDFNSFCRQQLKTLHVHKKNS